MEFLITFLLVFIGVIWILGKVLPRLLTWYLKGKIEKMGSAGGFGQPQGGDPAAAARMKEEQIRQSKAQEGRVTIVQQEQSEKVIERNMGEYVDYEEEK